MTKLEGSTIVISGDEYQIILNLGDLLVLKRNEFFTLYFEKQKILLTCGEKEKFTRKIVDVDSSKLTFFGIEFPKTDYTRGECGTKNIVSSLKGTRIVFNIDDKQKLVKVTE
jgi:hypothetical protein